MVNTFELYWQVSLVCGYKWQPINTCIFGQVEFWLIFAKSIVLSYHLHKTFFILIMVIILGIPIDHLTTPGFPRVVPTHVIPQILI